MRQATIEQAYALAVKYHQAGQLQDAERLYRQILAQQPDHAEAMQYLGVIAHQAGQIDVGVDLIRRAIALEPNSPTAYNHLANVLKDKGQLDEAMAAWRQALALNPTLAEVHSNLGNALASKGKFDEAIASYRQAIALKPDNAQAYSNLGLVLKDKGELDEAIAACHSAIELMPTSAEAYCNLGVALRDQGEFDQAIAAWRQAIVLKPNYADAHFSHSLGLLLRGDWEEGWAEHEWRWKVGRLSSARPFPQRCWAGEDLKGQTILLHAEQGMGDTIQFLRYVPLLTERGAEVVLEVQPELKGLAKFANRASCVVERGQPLPPFDFHCPMFTLPLALKTTVASIPKQIPYLTADPQLVDVWQKRLSGSKAGLKVGLVWAGSRTHRNDRNRSIALSQLSPLATIGGMQFYSLQKGEAAAQAKNPPPGMPITDWTNELNDFLDTAALVSQMDLVISVDTAVAHLAGAMGKRVWLLVPFVPDWRWMRDRTDSPWYPKMRLFRQKRGGDWEGVVAEVVGALSKAKTGGSRRAP